MKHIGRGIASIGICMGCCFMAAFTKDGCTTAAAMCIAMFIVWVDCD